MARSIRGSRKEQVSRERRDWLKLGAAGLGMGLMGTGIANAQSRQPRVVDLTLPTTDNMPGIPGVASYKKYPSRMFAASVMSESQRQFLQGKGVTIGPEPDMRGTMNTVLSISSHSGTHIDAPRHMLETGIGVDEIPLERIVMREAVVLDLTHLPVGAGIVAADLEKTGVRPRSDQIAVIKTRYTDRFWGKPDFWTQITYMHPSVGDWILDKHPAAVAMDCFPEIPRWRGIPREGGLGVNHKKWMSKDIVMIQMITNLDAIGSNRFHMIALPLRLKDMDGSPARVVGVVM